MEVYVVIVSDYYSVITDVFDSKEKAKKAADEHIRKYKAEIKDLNVEKDTENEGTVYTGYTKEDGPVFSVEIKETQVK